MLTLTLELTAVSSQQEVHGLSRGHLSIGGSQGSVTSQGRTPDQSMMIFLSIVGLLHGLRRFLETASTRQYTFVGDDCSFQLTFERVKGQLFKITSQRQAIDTVGQDELTRAVWAGVEPFLSRYQDQLDGDMVLGDLISAVFEFRLAFDL